MVQLSGKDKVYSFVTYCRSRHASYEDNVPYNVSLVDLEEGPRWIVSHRFPTDQLRIRHRELLPG